MDYKNVDKWPRRFLLWAEPQIGKTGAFLLLLRDLVGRVASDQLETVVPVLNADQVDLSSPFFPEWFVPSKQKHFEKLRPYNELLTRKYHAKVAILRQELCVKKSGGNIAQFREAVLRLEGPLSLPASIQLGKAQVPTCNWDGFLTRDLRLGIAWDANKLLESDAEVAVRGASVAVVDSASKKVAADFLTKRAEGDLSGCHRLEIVLGTSCIVDEQGKALRLVLSVPQSLGGSIFVSDAKRLKLAQPWVKTREKSRFVLTPSYRVAGSEWLNLVSSTDKVGAKIGAFPEECQLDYSNVLDDAKNVRTVQVILVRAEQFDAYVNAWGASRVILCLPERLRYTSKAKLHHAEESAQKRIAESLVFCRARRSWIRAPRGAGVGVRDGDRNTAHVGRQYYCVHRAQGGFERQDDAGRSVIFAHFSAARGDHVCAHGGAQRKCGRLSEN